MIKPSTTLDGQIVFFKHLQDIGAVTKEQADKAIKEAKIDYKYQFINDRKQEAYIYD